jgi:hypothetical protein
MALPIEPTILKFVGREEFRSFKAQCETKGLDLMEEEFFVDQYPPGIARRFQRFLGKKHHLSSMQDPSTWFFVQEFRKRILSQPQNPVYGVCH